MNGSVSLVMAERYKHTSINVAHYLRDSTQYYKSGIRFPVWTQGLGKRQYLWSFLQGWWWEKFKKKRKGFVSVFLPASFFTHFRFSFRFTNSDENLIDLSSLTVAVEFSTEICL